MFWVWACISAWVPLYHTVCTQTYTQAQLLVKGEPLGARCWLTRLKQGPPLSADGPGWALGIAPALMAFSRSPAWAQGFGSFRKGTAVDEGENEIRRLSLPCSCAGSHSLLDLRAKQLVGKQAWGPRQVLAFSNKMQNPFRFTCSFSCSVLHKSNPPRTDTLKVLPPSCTSPIL